MRFSSRKIALTLIWLVGSLAYGQPYLLRDELVAVGRVDASLNCIAAATEDRLCAVGDRGAIWVSQNGGRTWQLADSPTTANLQAVSFAPLSPEGPSGLGLIVGGWIGNYTRSSHGLVLRSLDRGDTWQAVSGLPLPRLKGVRVLSDRCIAWGDWDATNKTCLFESRDGGLTWRGIPTGELGHAAAATVTAAGGLTVVDELGRGWFSEHGEPSRPLATAEQPLRRMLHTGRMWLASGSAGQVIFSNDGRRWNDVDLPLSPAARALCDFTAVAQVGEHIWLAGSPGSILLHSPDGGMSWELLRTGQTLPISSLIFLDAYRGWATGPLGNLLATRDGGRTWYPQLQASARLGVLSAAAGREDIPWLPLVTVAWEDGVAVAGVNCQAAEAIAKSDFLADSTAVLADAASKLGLAGHRTWVRKSASREDLRLRLAAEILTWKPDVVVAAGHLQGNQGLIESSSSGAFPLESQELELLSSTIAAVETLCLDAAQPVLRELDLPVWQVGKVVATCEPPGSHFSEHDGRILRGPGLSNWELMLPLPPDERNRAAQTAMYTAWAKSQTKASTASLLGGIAPSAETRRPVPAQALGNYQLVLGRVHRRKSMELLAQKAEQGTPLEQWSSDFGFIVLGLPEREIAPLLYELVETLQAPATWPYRTHALERLIQSNVDSDAADWARIELLTCQASDELRAWRAMRPLAPSVTKLASLSAESQLADGQIALASSSGKNAWNATPFESRTVVSDASAIARLNADAVVSASAELPVTSVQHVIRGVGGERSYGDPNLAIDAARWFEAWSAAGRASPSLLSRPDLNLVAHSLERRSRELTNGALSAGQQPTRHLESLLNGAAPIGWAQMAQQEVMLAAGQASQLRWQYQAVHADARPLLDGVLDESWWHQTSPMQLETLSPSTANAPQPTSIRWAFDKSYLYVGIHCPRPGREPILVAEQRQYDADLSGSDHVQITLDTDRDYRSVSEFAVSASGQTYDRCCGRSAFDPKWHVMVQPGPDGWTAEIAIELRALTTNPELVGTSWSVSARRWDPHGAPQSWSCLRTHQPLPQAGGVLSFVARPQH